jgi:hypothetical protein
VEFVRGDILNTCLVLRTLLLVQASVKLKENVDMVLSKGPTPDTDKLNNTDLKVTIQWNK